MSLENNSLVSFMYLLAAFAANSQAGDPNPFWGADTSDLYREPPSLPYVRLSPGPVLRIDLNAFCLGRLMCWAGPIDERL
ncbi:hypothetical protein YC2023_010777 [Brassica napus]